MLKSYGKSVYQFQSERTRIWEKYRFTAKECTVEGTAGYMVTRYREDGTIATDGFTTSDEYETICKAIGVVPELSTEE